MRVLAIDPGLAATGVGILDVTGYGRWTFVQAFTIRTNPKESLTHRLVKITAGMGRVDSPWRLPISECQAVVIECAANSKTFGKHSAQSTNLLMLATGALIARMGLVFGPEMVTEVPVTRWWPRRGRVMWRENEVIERARSIVPALKDESEHACTAVAIGDWWSRHDGLKYLTKGAA